MNVFAFEAKNVAVERQEGGLQLVGFADQESDPQLYLVLQRALEQDRTLGMDTFYVEWRGQEGSGYGGISRFELDRNGAKVLFEPGMAAVLDGIELLTIRFRLSQGEFLALHEALGHIFNGTDCLVVAGA